MSDPTVTTARLIAESSKVRHHTSEAIRRGETSVATEFMHKQAQLLHDAKAAVRDDANSAETPKQRL